jgi:hypothetical protein
MAVVQEANLKECQLPRHAERTGDRCQGHFSIRLLHWLAILTPVEYEITPQLKPGQMSAVARHRLDGNAGGVETDEDESGKDGSSGQETRSGQYDLIKAPATH